MHLYVYVYMSMYKFVYMHTMYLRTGACTVAYRSNSLSGWQYNRMQKQYRKVTHMSFRHAQVCRNTALIHQEGHMCIPAENMTFEQ